MLGRRHTHSFSNSNLSSVWTARASAVERSCKIPRRPALKYHYETQRAKAEAWPRPEAIGAAGSALSSLSPMAALAYLHQKRISMSQEHSELALSNIRQSEFPVTPAVALARYKSVLTPFERSEVTEYANIYFLGTKARKPTASFVDQEGFYLCPVADHIAYRYEIIEEISRGNFGKVIRCYDHRSNLIVAVKILKATEECHRLAQVESAVLAKLSADDAAADHHIIKLYNEFEFRGCHCFVFEALNITLLEYLETHGSEGIRSMPLIKSITRELLVALQFMHSFNFAHADLKPENVLFTDRSRSSVKLIDFGTVAMLETTDFDYVQSRHYRAPEIVLGNQYSQAIDMWSLGCLLYELYTGCIMCPADSEAELLSMIVHLIGAPPTSVIKTASRGRLVNSQRRVAQRTQSVGIPQSRLEANLGSANKKFKSFLLGLLRWDPAARLTAAEALEHPWLKTRQVPPPRASHSPFFRAPRTGR